MITIDLHENSGGKLFASTFVIIDWEPVAAIDDLVNIEVKGQWWGVAKVCAVESVHFRMLSRVLSWVSVGNSVHYQGLLLKRKAGEKVGPLSAINYLGMQWVERNMAIQDAELEDFWNNQKSERYAD